MSSHTFSIALLSEVGEREFASYGELEASVLEVINRHLASLPPRYSYRDFIHFAQRKGWIERLDHGRYRLTGVE